MVVWKFVLATIPTDVRDRQVLEMPVGAQMLTVQMQDDLLCLWALVDPNAPRASYTFRIAGTGHNIEEEKLLYIGSVLLFNDTIVFHVFQCD